MTHVSIKSFFKDNIWATLGHILIYAKGFIILPLLINNIGAANYGIYTLLISAVGFIYSISSLGIGFKYKRFMPSTNDKSERGKLFYQQFWFQVFLVLFLSIIILLCDDVIKSGFVGKNVSYSNYLICGVIIINVLWTQSVEFFRYTDKIGVYVLSTTITPYINIFLIIIFVVILRENDINHLLLASLISMGIVLMPCFYVLITEIGFKFFKMHKKSILQDLKLGFPLLSIIIIDFILTASDKYIIGFYVSATAVGYYNAAYVLGSTIILLPKVFGVVLPPKLYRFYDEGNMQQVEILIDYAIKVFLLLAIPFVTGSYILSEKILFLISNSEVALAAKDSVVFVSLGMLFYGLSIIISEIQYLKLNTHYVFTVNAIASIINFILNLYLIYLFRDIKIAAITTFFSYFLIFILIDYQTKKELGLSVCYDVALILKTIICSVIMGVIVKILGNFLTTSFITLLIQIILGICMYFILLLSLSAVNITDVRQAKSIMKKSREE